MSRISIVDRCNRHGTAEIGDMETPANKPPTVRLVTKRHSEPFLKGLIEVAGTKYWSSGPVEMLQEDDSIEYATGVLVLYDATAVIPVVATY
jgi:hypothetical protein